MGVLNNVLSDADMNYILDTLYEQEPVVYIATEILSSTLIFQKELLLYTKKDLIPFLSEKGITLYTFQSNLSYHVFFSQRFRNLLKNLLSKCKDENSYFFTSRKKKNALINRTTFRKYYAPFSNMGIKVDTYSLRNYFIIHYFFKTGDLSFIKDCCDIRRQHELFLYISSELLEIINSEKYKEPITNEKVALMCSYIKTTLTVIADPDFLNNLSEHEISFLHAMLQTTGKALTLYNTK